MLIARCRLNYYQVLNTNYRSRYQLIFSLLTGVYSQARNALQSSVPAALIRGSNQRKSV